MRFTKTHSIIIISLVLLSLAGLAFIQFNWLKGAMVIREENIQSQLDEVIETLQADLEHRFTQKGFFTRRSCNNNRVDQQNLALEVYIALDSILKKEKLRMPFEFGFTSCKSKDYYWFSNPDNIPKILEGTDIQVGPCSFINQQGLADHLHFFFIFPRQERFIFSQLSTAIGSSILFILLLIAAFLYMLFTILRQKKLSEMKNDFINNLTHEFKTPIASISLAAKTLKRLEPVKESEKANSYLQLIDQEGKRLENHIDKVLQMANLDSGNFRLDLQHVDMREIIEKVAKSLSMILENKAGRFNLYFPGPCYVKADPMHLFNIVYNLADNAIKYNNGKPEIAITCKNTTEGVQLSVCDNGIGMSKEVQRQVFERFFRQTDGDIHNVKGFGLGLAYVKRMMEAHGGHIELESQKGVGTNFHLFFPHAQKEEYV